MIMILMILVVMMIMMRTCDGLHYVNDGDDGADKRGGGDIVDE